MDFNTILIQNDISNNTFKKRNTNKRSIEYQQMVNSHQKNNINLNITQNSFININENEFKNVVKSTTTLTSASSNKKQRSNNNNSNNKKQKKDIELISKNVNVVEELIKYFNNNNNKVFNLIELAEHLNLKISKFEEVIEILSILKIVKLHQSSYSFEWVGVGNDFINLLNEIQSSKYNYVTGELEILCEGCKSQSNNNNYNNKLKDYSRYRIDDISYQIIKLIINTKNINGTSCLPIDTISNNLYNNINEHDKHSNILSHSRHVKLAQRVLNTLKGLDLINIKTLNNNFNVYYWIFPKPIQCCYF